MVAAVTTKTVVGTVISRSIGRVVSLARISTTLDIVVLGIGVVVFGQNMAVVNKNFVAPPIEDDACILVVQAMAIVHVVVV